MKIGGVTLTPPPEEILVLPRDPEPIVFRARAVTDWDQFETMVPDPKPPVMLVKGEGQKLDYDDVGYKALVNAKNAQRMAWMVVKSLEPSAIEWDTVDLLRPSTLLNWEADLLNGGLLQIEVNKVYELCQIANCLDETKLEAARKSFLRGQQAA